jgi:hypothetical protein
MKRASVFQLVGILSAMLASSIAQAAPIWVPISDLYNTGMSSPWNAGTQTPIAGTDPKLAGSPTINDPHWDVTLPSSATVSTRVFDDRNATDTDWVFPFNLGPTGRLQRDLDDDPNRVNTNLDNSQWIRPDTVSNFNPAGTYVFKTTFTTSQPLTAITISGFFKAVDLVGVELNGGPITWISSGLLPYLDTKPIYPARTFTITGTGGLTNTLRFHVVQPGTNLMPFRVQFSNAAFTIPEPSTLALGALGLVGFGITRLRRRRNSASQA